MKGLLRFITFLVFVGIILLAFLFAVNNTTKVGLWLGTTLPPMGVGVLVIIAFIAGGLLGLLLGLGIFRQLRYKLKIRQLKTQLERSGDSGSEAQPVTRKG